MPIVLLATGSVVSRVRRNLSTNTSSCVIGPFRVSLLGTHVQGLLSLHRGVGAVCKRAFSLGRFKIRRPGRRSSFLAQCVRVMGTGVSGPRLSMSIVCRTLKVDQAGFCEGMGAMAKLSPVRLVGGVHLRTNTGLLGRSSVGVSRVTRRVNFDDHSCFTHDFGTICKVSPARCRRAGSRSWRYVCRGSSGWVFFDALMCFCPLLRWGCAYLTYVFRSFSVGGG